MLERLGVGAYKIGSDDAGNLPFLRHVAGCGKPMLLSTGMCTLAEVREAVEAVLAVRNVKLILLHAITSYPTHPENVNLAAMQTLMREFPGLDVGYSDHTLDNTACICAAAMGARVIEKHFTWDKNADGPDHRLSADPAEMTALVRSIRGFEIMRGDGVKQPAASEAVTRRNNRKSIVLQRPVRAGAALSAQDLAVKRPGYGIAPRHVEELVGRVVRRDLDADDVLEWEDLV
jgi:N-acetylneuraminate synthase